MRLCRFDDDRLGWVNGSRVHDVSRVLERLPPFRWPLPAFDPLIAALDELRAPLAAEAGRAAPAPLDSVILRSPVPRPGKIVAVRRNRGESRSPAPHLFLKAPSSVAGPGDGIRLPPLDRKVECELELALVIGVVHPRPAIAGYCLALDLAVAGQEDRGLRKSADTFCVLGPWLTTVDESPDPVTLAIELELDGELRQHGRIADQPFPPAQVIGHVSRFVTLQPGDVILGGCPAPAIEIGPGDRLRARVRGVAEMHVNVLPADTGLRRR